METAPWYSCLLCGSGIRDNKDPSTAWQHRFRILFFSRGFRVSGIGIYKKEQPHVFIVPLYERVCSLNDARTLVQASVMDQKAGSVYGFILHDACWSLMNECNQNRPIDTSRLWDVFRSTRITPLWCRIPSWSHTYGGLFSYQKLSQRPNAANKAKRDMRSQAGRQSHKDPYDVPDVRRLLQERPELPPEHPPGSNHKEIQVWKSDGCFTKLPPEVLDQVASYLPVTDVLSCRLVSRAFTSIFFMQRFWADRFKPGRECAFFFEARRVTVSVCDWRSLYLHLQKRNLAGGLVNRRRIWALAELVLEKLNLEWCHDLATCIADPRRGSDTWQENMYRIGWESSKEYDSLYQPSVPSRTQSALVHFIPAIIRVTLLRVAIDADTAIANATFVAGFELVSRDGKHNIYFGYRTSSWSPVVTEFTDFNGFVLSVAPDGVHALRVIGVGYSMSRWIGTPVNLENSIRHLAGYRIRGLTAGFDGYKMVALAVFFDPDKNVAGVD